MNAAAMNWSKPTSDNNLVLLAKNGNTGAFSALSEKYMHIVKSRADRYSSVVGVDIEDFVQEGLLALFRAVKGYDDSLGIQFNTYAITCINNSMATAIKKHMKNLQNTDVSIDGDGWQQFDAPTAEKSMPVEDMFFKQEENAQLAWQVQSLLSNFERQVLKLYLRGHSYLQISRLLSTTTKAVDNALQRVRRKLRPELY